MEKMAEQGERAGRSFAARIKERRKRLKTEGGIMNFKSYMRPGGLASRGALAIIVAVSLSLWGAGAEAQKHTPVMELTPELLIIRDDLAKYKDPFIAVRDGYLSTVGCVQYPDGDMGVHFLNIALIGPEPDPAKPPVLMYEPGSDGKLQLIAVEWFVPLATGVKGRPALFGQDFHGPMAGHEPLIPDGLHHYDLHVWLFKRNPSGVFYHANPDVDCTKGAIYPLREEPPRMVPHN